MIAIVCVLQSRQRHLSKCGVQSESVPVVRTSHLVPRMLKGIPLSEVSRWLSTREYLPVEGQHYEIIDIIARVGNWEVKWYCIKPLVCGEYA